MNNALYTFQVERTKQHKVLNAMKEELSQMKEPVGSPRTKLRSEDKKTRCSSPILEASGMKLQHLQQQIDSLLNKLNKYKTKKKELKQKLKASEKQNKDMHITIDEYENEIKEFGEEHEQLKDRLSERDKSWLSPHRSSKMFLELADTKNELTRKKLELNEHVSANSILRKEVEQLNTKILQNDL